MITITSNQRIKTVALGSIASIVNGATPDTSTPEYWDGKIPWVTPTDIGNLNSMFLSDTERKITPLGLDSCSSSMIPEFSILLTSRAPVGNIAVNTVPVCTNQGFKSIIPHEEYHWGYIYHYLCFLRADIQKLSHGNTFKEITKDKVESLTIVIPKDYEEQVAIAKRLDVLLRNSEQAFDAVRRQEAALYALPSAILRSFFKWEAMEVLPEGWKWKALEDIAIIDPKKPDSHSCNDNDHVSFLPMEGIDDVTGTVADLQQTRYGEVQNGYTYFEEGDILFAKITPSMENGKCAIVSGLMNGFGYGSTEVFVIRPVDVALRCWIFYYLRTAEFRRIAEKNFSGSAGQRRVPAKFLKKTLVPVPTNTDILDELVTSIQKQLSACYDSFKSIEKQHDAISNLANAILRETFAMRKES